jgi:Phage integrase family
MEIGPLLPPAAYRGSTFFIYRGAPRIGSPVHRGNAPEQSSRISFPPPSSSWSPNQTRVRKREEEVFSDDVRPEVECSDSSICATQQDSSASSGTTQITARTSEVAIERELCPATSSPEAAGGPERASIPASTVLSHRRKLMSTRPGQNGTVIRHGNTWRGRWLEDVAGQSKRIRRSILLGSCDSMTKPQARRKLREFLEKQGINDVNYLIPSETPALVFAQAADKWMAGRMTLLKPSTRRTMKSQIRKHLRPRLLNVGVDRINSDLVKDLVVEWNKQGLSRNTIKNLVVTLGLILGKTFGDVKLPKRVNAEEEARWFTQEQSQQIVSLSEGMYKVLFAVAAGTGMREGELFGLQVEDVDLANSLIHVRRSVWEGRQQSPKSRNAYRQVGIDAELVQMLRGYIGERATGYLFRSRRCLDRS